MNNRVGLYIRLSQMDDYMKNKYESESVESQRMLLTDYANEHSFNIINEYVDDGYSGTNFNRPAFKRMMKDLKDNVIDTIIVKDLSRLGRDHIETGYFVETYFPQNHIRFISILENLDSALQKDYSDSITFVMACNDYLSKQNSLKIRAILDMKKKEGKYVGSSNPYGYMRDPKDKGHLIPDPNTAPIVKFIFKLAEEGKNSPYIANILNDKGYLPLGKYKKLKNCTHNKWSGKDINRILSNQMYVGDMVQNKSTTASYKSDKKISNPKQNWIIVKNTHEPLVERDVFNKLQNPKKRSCYTINGRKKELLENIVYCKECGSSVSFYGPKDGNVLKGDCNNYKKYNERCFNRCITYSDFERKILNYLGMDKEKLTREKIQCLIDTIFVDKNKEITIILKDKKSKPIIIDSL